MRERFRLLCGRFVPAASLLLVALSFIVVTVLVVLLYQVFFSPPVVPNGQASDRGLEGLLVVMGFAGKWYVQILLFLAIAGTYLFVPGLIATVLSLPAAVLWRQPKKILLLRPFSAQDRSRRLLSVVRSGLYQVGHIYTLADRDIKTPWVIRFPALLTQLVFLHFRPRRVRSARHLERLLRMMDVDWARNVNWIVSWTKVFALRCSDETWRETVTAISKRVDAILIDLSETSENINWEIQECARRGLLDRLFFTRVGKSREETLDYLQRLGVDGVSEHQIFNGEIDFGEAFLSSLKAVPRQEEKVRPGRLWNHALATVRMVGPIAWVTAVIVAVMLINQNLDESQGPVSRAVADLRQDPADPVKFRHLLSTLLESSGRTLKNPYLEMLDGMARLQWEERFRGHVVPLLLMLWDSRPEWRTEMLINLRQLARAEASPVWDRALESELATDQWISVLEGIRESRSVANVVDLVDVMDRLSVQQCRDIIDVLAALGAPVCAEALYLRYVFPDARPRDAVNTAQAREALRRILPYPHLVHAPQSPKNILVLADSPLDGWKLVRAMVQFKPENTEVDLSLPVEGISLPKPTDKIKIVCTVISYTAPSGRYDFFYIPFRHEVIKTVVASGHTFDAALILKREDDSDMLLSLASLIGDGETSRMVIMNALSTGGEGFEKKLERYQTNKRIDVFRVREGSLPDGKEMERLIGVLEPDENKAADRTRFAVAAVCGTGISRDVLGYFEEGDVSPGDRLEIVGLGSAGARAEVVEKISLFDQDIRLGLRLRVPSDVALEPGQIMMKPGAEQARQRLRALAYLLSPEEGGKDAAISVLDAYAYRFGAAEFPAKRIHSGAGTVGGGNGFVFELELFDPLAIRSGQRFSISKDEQLRGIGLITHVLDDWGMGELTDSLGMVTFRIPATEATRLLTEAHALLGNNESDRAQELLYQAVYAEDPRLELEAWTKLAGEKEKSCRERNDFIDCSEALSYYHRVIRVYERMAKLRAPDMDHWGGEALYWARIALLWGHVGQADRAEEAMLRANELLAKIPPDDPEGQQWRQALRRTITGER